MSDIVTLGLAIDSRQAVAASDALDKLAASARPAEAAANALQKTAAQGAANTQKMAQAANVAAEATRALSTQGQAAFHSLRSMTEQAALGVPVTTLLTQQLNHLTFAATGPGGIKGAFGEVFGVVRGLLSPTVLLAGGIAATGVAAFAAFSSWQHFALQLDDTRRIMGVTSSEAAKLQAAASFRGIGSDEFAAAMKRAAGNIYDARNGMGGLAELFRANGVQARTFNDYLEGAANLIQRTQDNQQRLNILGALGLPQTQEWVRLLEGGAAGIRKATEEAANFGGKANDELVAKAREFTEAWDRAWTQFGLHARAAVVSAVQGFGELDVKKQVEIQKGILESLDGRAGSIAAQGRRRAQAELERLLTLQREAEAKLPPSVATPSVGPGAGTGSVVDPAKAQRDLSVEQQRISILGALATVQQTVRLQEIGIIQARANGVVVTKEEERAVLSFAAANALGLTQIRQQTESFRSEAAAVGLGTGAAAAFRAEQERLADFRIRGVTLTNDQTAALHREAQALGEAAQKAAELRVQSDLRFATSQLGRTDVEQQVATQLRALYGDEYQQHLNDAIANQIRLNELMRDAKGFAQDALSGFIKDLRDGKSLGDALHGVLGKLENKLIDIASNQIISGLFASLLGGSGAGGGIIGSMFGVHHTGYGPGDAMSYRFVSTPVNTLPRFHDGIGPGERPAVIRNDESVLTPGQMRAMGRMGGGAVYVTVNNAPAGTGANANVSRDGEGNMRVDVWLERQVDDTSAAMIDSGQSAINRSIERRYGLSPKL